MKKSFLIAASAITLMLSACGSKNTAPESNENSETTEQQTIAQEDNQTVSAKASNDKEFSIRNLYTVTVPDGWKGQNNEFNAILEKPNENGQSVIRVAVMFMEDMNVDESAQEDGLKLENKIGDEKIGDITWTLFKRQNTDPTDFGAFVYVPSLKGTIYAQCFSKGGFNEDLKEGIASIKLK